MTLLECAEPAQQARHDLITKKTNMTQKQIEALQREIAGLRGQISEEVGSSTMDLIEELINLEIELEAECNK